MFERLICKFSGHRFVEFCDHLKRRCERCDREEWVMSNPYPLIGEPKYYWHHMDYESLDTRRVKKHLPRGLQGGYQPRTSAYLGKPPTGGSGAKPPSNGGYWKGSDGGSKG